MGDNLRNWTMRPDWPLAYLIVTAISIGVLVGVQHWFPGSMRRFELLPIGFIVGMYTATSALHYYRATREKPPRGIVSRNEW